MKKIFGVVLALIVSLGFAATAQAVDETIDIETTITPRSGPLYKDAFTPVDLSIHAKVHPRAGIAENEKVNPLKRATITFPGDLDFVPHDNVTPPCNIPELADGRPELANGPGWFVDKCPKSVIGTGTAAIWIAKYWSGTDPSKPLKDPVLVIFNAGTDNQGNAKLKIYGYSKGTGVGIIMNGTYKDNVLDIQIPMLSNDSAVDYFTLEIPGMRLQRPELGLDTQGLDPNYAQARCSTGQWVTKGIFELGERDPSTQQPTTPTETVVAPDSVKTCTGVSGKGKIGKVKVKGPAKVKRGKKATYRVTIKNTGKAVAKGVKIVAKGKGAKGSAKVGSIAAGKSKTVKVKVKFTKRGKSKVTFRAKSKNSGSGKAKKVVKVK